MPNANKTSCVLAEMCAGEPVFAGPSSSSSEGPSGIGGKRGWVEAAAELPSELRRTIRSLTHPDPDKVGGPCVGGIGAGSPRIEQTTLLHLAALNREPGSRNRFCEQGVVDFKKPFCRNFKGTPAPAKKRTRLLPL